MPARQTLLATISDDFRNKPDDVSIIEILACVRTWTSDRFKERAIYCNGNFGTPPP